MNSHWASDQPFMSDSDFAELLWEKGQPVAQGQHPDRARRSSSPQEKEGRDVSVPRLGKLGGLDAFDPMANGSSSFACYGHAELDAREDDMVPWADYAIESPLRNDYCSEFLNEFSDTDFSLPSAHSNTVLDDRSNGFDQAPVALWSVNDRLVSKEPQANPEPSRRSTLQLCQESQQHQTAAGPSTISGATATKKSTTRSRHSLSEALLNSRLQKPDEAGSKSLQQKSCVSLVNFPQFSRMVSNKKAKLQDGGMSKSSKKASVSVSSSPMDSSLVQSSCGMISGCAIQSKSASVLQALRLEAPAGPPQEVLAVEKLKAACQEDTLKKKDINGCSRDNNVICSSSRWRDHVQNSSIKPNLASGRHETAKSPEVVVSSSAVQSKSAAASVLQTMRIEATDGPPQEVLAVEKLKAVCQEGTLRKKDMSGCSIDNNVTCSSSRWHDHVQNSSFAPNLASGRHETGKSPEIMVSSSACSGSSFEPLSIDTKQGEKRKNREEDMGYQSENLEDAPSGSKKPSFQSGMDAKKCRAAEVHNLSERRRRDKINEKMRGLQDLIPNCNKVDKASVLDEAIEYIKTLQMQLQIIAMQNGLCMPPMMVPSGQQQMRAPVMAHFSPMGLGYGMGVGLGYRMGMYDANGVPRFPMIPVHPMAGSQFPCPPGVCAVPGSSRHPMLGMPRQGIPVPIPRPPSFAASPGLPRMTSLPSETSGMTASNTSAADTASNLHSKDQQHQSMNLDKTQEKY